MLIIWLIILCLSLFVLSKAADKFTDVAEKIGTLLKMPSFVIGVLIVSVGTSVPELFTSIFAVLKGESAVLAANISGSNVANILLGLGLVVVISKKTSKFNWDSVANDMPFLIGSVILLIITASDGIVTAMEAAVFMIAYIIYVFYSLNIKKTNPKKVRDDLSREIKSKTQQDFIDNKLEKKDKQSKIKLTLTFIVSLAIIFISAHYTIDALLNLALIIGISAPVVAASLVALGTSLPEISVGISSAKKGNFDLVLGNITGSNIFNILFIFGSVGLFANLTITAEIINFVIPMVVAATLIQWLVTIDKKITVTEGLFMSLLYFLFIGKLYQFI